jgi:hypothetical protein
LRQVSRQDRRLNLGENRTRQVWQNELLHDFSFAYRNPGDVKKKVIRIREVGSKADICKLLILSAPVGFDPPQRLLTLPNTIFVVPNAISPSTAEIFMLTAENNPPLSGFLCPQRDLSGPCAISLGHNEFEPPQRKSWCSQQELSGHSRIFYSPSATARLYRVVLLYNNYIFQ